MDCPAQWSLEIRLVNSPPRAERRRSRRGIRGRSAGGASGSGLHRGPRRTRGPVRPRLAAAIVSLGLCDLRANLLQLGLGSGELWMSVVFHAIEVCIRPFIFRELRPKSPGMVFEVAQLEAGFRQLLLGRLARFFQLLGAPLGVFTQRLHFGALFGRLGQGRRFGLMMCGAGDGQQQRRQHTSCKSIRRGTGTAKCRAPPAESFGRLIGAYLVPRSDVRRVGSSRTGATPFVDSFIRTSSILTAAARLNTVCSKCFAPNKRPGSIQRVFQPGDFSGGLDGFLEHLSLAACSVVAADMGFWTCSAAVSDIFAHCWAAATTDESQNSAWRLTRLRWPGSWLGHAADGEK